jgi:ubiquinone/menaquinone biosynthesis C-methylase UbiE
MGLWDQFQRPTGQLGRIIASRMNREHFELTTWGLNHVTIDPNYVLLDVGCGGGKTINRLAQLVPQSKVYGIDYSPDMVTYAKKVNKKLVEENKVEIHEASADNTGFPDGTFDLVTACETYYFWPNLPAAFQEINRILKPNGRLLMINEMIKDGFYDVKDAAIIEKTHLRLFPLEEIRGFLQSAGFVNVSVHRKEASPWNSVVAQKPEA